MDREDIIRIAREAGFRDTTTPVVALGVSWEQVQRFADLVAAAAKAEENEACAKVCEDMDHNGVMIAADCAEAIRARKNT
jgi:hypothetical protein